MNRIYYSKEMKPRAQQLRREETRHENLLWYQHLKTYPVQFRRQRQFGRYMADFYCSSAKLIIEADGMQHAHPDSVAYDRSRTAYLENLGLYVLRFAHREIEEEFEAVCRLIDQTVRRRIKPSPLGKAARQSHAGKGPLQSIAG